ncbi:MAG: DNA mismatch repair endonuclease MutL, partial [Clostridiales bacterium]|nr:DNA mismatch repair endonuclease MutL [Clostridiales bacterium]
MAKIQVLDKSVSELIAAGEVIERPASIVKELLENAIDAKASAVTVEIKQGGIGFIRITDNGIGIAREDVPTAFLRHATSKVRTEDDLTNIATLGFRGEALASVCAVAKVELITKTAGQELGSRYLIQGGENGTLEEAGCPNGTTIIVRDLFYNVPARLKFLKKDFSEGNAVQGIVEKIALSHPEVSVKLIKENKMVLHTSGNRDLRSAIYSVFGKDFAAGLLPVNYQHNGIRVSGFITKPACSRTNRSMQHFFVNDRYVKTRTGMAALEEGYKHSIMVGKFPACVLKLGIDYSLVDVNVHPAKIEIRFVQERPVFEAIYFAVKSALEQE